MSSSHLIAGLVGTASAIDNFDCPDVSCKGRCGSILSSDSQALLCSCDKKCVMFGDCCRDFYDVCPNIQSPPSFTYNHGHVSCLQLPIKTQANRVRPSNHFFGQATSLFDRLICRFPEYIFSFGTLQPRFGVFGISACPRAYPEGNTTGVICGLMYNPYKAAKSQLRYQNAFCESCWKGFEEDAIVNYLKNKTRHCLLDLIGMCKEGTEFNALKGNFDRVDAF